MTAGPVTFRVFGSQREMIRTLRAEKRREGTGEVTESDVQGLMETRRVYSGPQMRLRPGMGRVNLHRARLGIVVVTHEFGHAGGTSRAGTRCPSRKGSSTHRAR